MPKTITVHGGVELSQRHNRREDKFLQQDHIDPELTCNNVVIIDMPIEQAYDEIFGEAVREYNKKQKRNDRKIDNYYSKIKHSKQKHIDYELIVQIGDKDTTGIDAPAEKKALIKFAENWDSRNPNLRLVGAYIHCDEPGGTIHMHCDYIPVAECTRGMRLQNSLDRALQQQGCKSYGKFNTAQIAWQDKERKALRDICIGMGIDADVGLGEDKHSHFDTSTYKAYAVQIQALKNNIIQLEQLRDICGEIKPYKGKFVMPTIIEHKPSGFGKGKIDTVRISCADYNKLIQIAQKSNNFDSLLDNISRRLQIFFDNGGDISDFIEKYDAKISALERELERKNDEISKKISDLQDDNLDLIVKNASLENEIAKLKDKLKSQNQLLNEFYSALATCPMNVRKEFLQKIPDFGKRTVIEYKIKNHGESEEKYRGQELIK